MVGQVLTSAKTSPRFAPSTTVAEPNMPASGADDGNIGGGGDKSASRPSSSSHRRSVASDMVGQVLTSAKTSPRFATSN